MDNDEMELGELGTSRDEREQYITDMTLWLGDELKECIQAMTSLVIGFIQKSPYGGRLTEQQEIDLEASLVELVLDLKPVIEARDHSASECGEYVEEWEYRWLANRRAAPHTELFKAIASSIDPASAAKFFGERIIQNPATLQAKGVDV